MGHPVFVFVGLSVSHMLNIMMSYRVVSVFYFSVFYCATPCQLGIGLCHSRVSVCLFVTSQCSTETAKRSIRQTTPHIFPGTQFSDANDLGKNLTGLYPNGSPNAGGVQVKIGDFRQITRYSSKTSTVASVANLVRSQVYDTELPPLFAACLCCACSASRAGSSAIVDTCIP